MISKIMENGFIALAAYIYVFALISLILFVAAAVANAFMKHGKLIWQRYANFFDESCVHADFALLDYFLV